MVIAKEIVKKIKHKTVSVIYKTGGRNPWSLGYSEYKEDAIKAVLNNQELLGVFLSHGRLPSGYGYGIDERIVEYPWLFSRLGSDAGYLLDAGSALNQPYILSQRSLMRKSLICYNFGNKEERTNSKNISYLIGDLRKISLKDNALDEIVCVSTLEHIGMDNTFLYSDNSTYREKHKEDFKITISELRRVLKPGGSLFLTVPYGAYEDHNWLQQFDGKMINSIVDLFPGREIDYAYYRYNAEGWQISDAESCRNASYFDINRGKKLDLDHAAAARAVACLAIRKNVQ